MKDNFSDESALYAKFRPLYPNEIYDYLLSRILSRECAWDVGTGNGQVARELAKYYDEVYATDISSKQLENAVNLPNVYYSICAAEKTNFDDNRFNLITVAQALHWFNFDLFFLEVKRVAKKGALIAVFGYGLFKSFPEADKLIQELYSDILVAFWDPERKYIDNSYETIDFPFAEVEQKTFEMKVEFDFEELLGYLNTWSAVKHYKKIKGSNPLELVKDRLSPIWIGKQKIHFPIFLKAGTVF